MDRAAAPHAPRPGDDIDGALELVAPFRDGALDVVAVSPRIDSSRVEGLDRLEPVAVG